MTKSWKRMYQSNFWNKFEVGNIMKPLISDHCHRWTKPNSPKPPIQTSICNLLNEPFRIKGVQSSFFTMLSWCFVKMDHNLRTQKCLAQFSWCPLKVELVHLQIKCVISHSESFCLSLWDWCSFIYVRYSNKDTENWMSQIQRIGLSSGPAQTNLLLEAVTSFLTPG